MSYSQLDPESVILAHQPEFRLRKRPENQIWEIVWTDEDGRPKRRSTKTRNDTEAKRQLAELILSGDTRPPKHVSLGYIIDRYFLHIQKEKAEGTVVPMQSKVARLKEFLGDVAWEDFSQEYVDDYKDWARSIKRWEKHDHKETNGTLSNGTIEKDLQTLRSALKFAHLRKIVPVETKIEIKDLPGNRRQTWLSDDQFDGCLKRCLEDEREHLYAFLILGVATGARAGALFELKWSDIFMPGFDMVNGKSLPGHEPVFNFRTEQVVKGAYIDFGQGHGNKKRPKMPIGQNWRVVQYLCMKNRNSDFVITYHGKPVQSLKKGLETVGGEAGLPFKLTHHVLKRTCITWLVRAGMPYETIEKLTNTSVETLRKHYDHHRPDLEEDLGNILAR
jgi:integrase